MRTLCLIASLLTLGVVVSWAKAHDQSPADAADRSANTKPSCERAADKWFKKHFPEPEERTKVGWGKAKYTSHSSTAKGGCFMEVIETAHIEKNAVTDTGDTETHHLIDLKTGQEIGQLVVVSSPTAPFTICELGQIKCLNADGWNALLGPYMRD